MQRVMVRFYDDLKRFTNYFEGSELKNYLPITHEINAERGNEVQVRQFNSHITGNSHIANSHITNNRMINNQVSNRNGNFVHKPSMVTSTLIEQSDGNDKYNDRYSHVNEGSPPSQLKSRQKPLQIGRKIIKIE